MFKSLLHTIFHRRHFWRHATFSEIAELYASRMLRMSAIHIIGAFMSIFLFQLGYSVMEIAFFWAAFYFFKVVAALPVAAFVGWIGPKHSILISNLLYIPSMILFAMLPAFGPWLLLPILLLQGTSASMYSIAYSIDFSKVKSTEHAGKEIGYMNIIEKLTTGLSPLIGGFLAFIAGPQVVIIISAILFALSAVPLMRTGEQVNTRIKLKFRGFPWRLLLRHSLAQVSYGFDVFASGTVWTLYTAVVVIGISSNNEIYAASGILLSVIFFAALIASYTFGKIIDRRRGKELMRAGAIANALTHFMRPFTGSPIAIAGLNATNEVATTGYTMPYTRALFDNADLSGARTTYLGLTDLIANFGAGVGALVLAFMVPYLGEQPTLTNFFFISAAVALLVLTARFPLYKK